MCIACVSLPRLLYRYPAFSPSEPLPRCLQEVFNSGIFPGQTDFIVFRDDGQIPGLDLGPLASSLPCQVAWICC